MRGYTPTSRYLRYLSPALLLASVIQIKNTTRKRHHRRSHHLLLDTPAISPSKTLMCGKKAASSRRRLSLIEAQNDVIGSSGLCPTTGPSAPESLGKEAIDGLMLCKLTNPRALHGTLSIEVLQGPQTSTALNHCSHVPTNCAAPGCCGGQSCRAQRLYSCCVQGARRGARADWRYVTLLLRWIGLV